MATNNATAKPKRSLQDRVRYTGRVLAALGLVTALGYSVISIWSTTRIVAENYSFFGDSDTIVVDAAAVVVFPIVLLFFGLRCINTLARYNMTNRVVNRDGVVDPEAREMLRSVGKKLVIIDGKLYEKIHGGFLLIFLTVALLYIGGTASAYVSYLAEDVRIHQRLVKEILEWHTLMLILTLSSAHLFLGERAKYLMLGLYETDIEHNGEYAREFKIMREVLATKAVMIIGVSRETSCYSKTLQAIDGIKLPPATVEELKIWKWDEYVKPTFWGGGHYTVVDPGDPGAVALSTLADTDRVCSYRGYPTATQKKNAMKTFPKDMLP